MGKERGKWGKEGKWGKRTIKRKKIGKTKGKWEIEEKMKNDFFKFIYFFKFLLQ